MHEDQSSLFKVPVQAPQVMGCADQYGPTAKFVMDKTFDQNIKEMS